MLEPWLQLDSCSKSILSCQKIRAHTQVVDALLKELCAALLESDVNVKLVGSLRNKVKTKVKKLLEEAENAGGKESNKKNIVQKVSPLTMLKILSSDHQAVFDELVALVDPGIEPYKPVKGKVNVLMAVGIQGAGKTTTCTKVSSGVAGFDSADR